MKGSTAMALEPPGRITTEPIVYDQVLKVCTTCGAVVGNNYAERHAQRHLDAGEEFKLPSLEEAERAGDVVRAREIARAAARRQRELDDAKARDRRADKLGISLEQLAEVEAAERAQADRDRVEATARDRRIAADTAASARLDA
jgi:hypothetical protein